MKRILFVDDEPQILDGLRGALRKQRAQWEMIFANSGAAALEHLRSASFDVIVSDIRMPSMDGAALLERVKAEFPNVIRIVLSGHADREAIVRALPVSHQFLSKPCDGAVLKNVIERACNLQDLLQNEALRKVVGQTTTLPTLPRVYWELTRALGNSETSNKKLASIIEQDAALSLTLLQIVNSSYFGLARKISSVEPAVAYLGLELVRSLTLTAQVFGSLHKAPRIAGFSFELLQEQSLLTARVARQIPSDPKEQEVAFTAALLHDVGKVILALGVPAQMKTIVELVTHDGTPMHVIEQEVLGVTHAEVGAYLLGAWGLPLPIVEAVAYHHFPARVEQNGLDALAAVHIADALVDTCVPRVPGVTENPSLDPRYLESLGVANDLPKWTAFAIKEAEKWST